MMIYSRLSPLLLVIAAALLPFFVKVDALTRRPAAVSIETASFQRRTASGKKNSAAFLSSAPRGGAATEESDGGVEAEVDEDTSEVEEETVEGIVEEIKEVIEEGIEELVEEIEEAVEDAAEAEEAVAEEVDEEEVEVVFPTDEIPSDDVRAFHTTDGELADDEGVYTDGQNESPIAENEAAEDTIAATEETAHGGDDDDGEVEEESAALGATAVRAGAAVAVIDEEVKSVLITELRYTEEDVANMRPEIAIDVVNNKLARPTEGMPKNWYIDPDAAIAKPSILAKKKGLILTVAVVGAAAISIGVLKDNDAIGDTVEEIGDALKAIPKSVAALVVAAKNTVTGGKKKAPALKAAETPAEEEEDEPETKDTGVHSIKPGTKSNEVPDPDVDTTWLDKVLTRIGGLFKSFMDIKI